MRAVLFFLSLCILLLAGGAYVHAAAYYDHHGASSAAAPGKNCRKRMLPVRGDHANAADADPDQIECLISDDQDDEDPSTVPAPKYRVAAVRQLLPYAHPPLRFIRKYLSMPYGRAASCTVQVCDRYLRQGVLRI